VKGEYMRERMTEEQKLLAIRIRQKWVSLFFDNIKSGLGINKPAFEEGIGWIYKNIFSRKDIPKIIYCDSLTAYTMERDILKDTGQLSGGSVEAFYMEGIAKLFDRVIWNPIKDSMKRSLIYDIVNFICEHIKNCILLNVLNPLWLHTSTLNRIFYNSSQSRVYIDDGEGFGGCALYDFLVKAEFLMPDDSFKEYRNFVKSGFYDFFIYEDYVFAVQPPVHLSLNESGRLHSTEGPAAKFRDGTRHYSINGRSVPEWIFEEKDSITREKFLNEKNAETKAAIYEVLGHKKIMEMLGAETVHTSEITHANGDVETVELLKTRDRFPEIENQPLAWVKVTCPSTGTNYLLGVEPKYENAAEAVASLSMFDAGEYSFNFRT
jgi:hypothetical protein